MKNLHIIFCLLALVILIFPAMSCEEPAVIIDFTASPSTIAEGGSSTLQWSTAGVHKANLNNGIGDVIASGTAIVTPAVTTRYVLTIVKDTQVITREVTVTVNKESFAAPAQQPSSAQPATSPAQEGKWVPANLRYDNLGKADEDYLDDQVAVWHTYAKMAGTSPAATAFYSNNLRGQPISLGGAGSAVKSPLLIVPGDTGMVCIIRNYSQTSYRYFEIVTTSYGDIRDESERLAQPGYGLAVTFSPEKKPYKIQKINMAAIAKHSGAEGEYDLCQFIVRILDTRGKPVWSKSLPWSYFRNTSEAAVPRAFWKDIPVDDVIVDGDFTVEVLSESNEYKAGRSKTYHYLALAYERTGDKDVKTRSFISDFNGRDIMTEKMPEPAGCGPVMNKLKQLLIVKTGTTYPAVREKAGDFDDMIIDKMGLKRGDVAVCSIYQGDALLKPEGFRCVIITGSHDMVTDRSPWMLDLMDWVRDKAYGKVPLLGICFGHQLMAMALGGTADFHPRGVELGTVEVEMTAEGRTDPLMAGLPARFYAHATHAQTVSVTPPGTRVLAYNSHEQHHALAFGKKAWGVQFHPEYSADVVRGYIEQARRGLESRGYNVDGMLDAVQESPWGGMILKRFLELAAD